MIGQRHAGRGVLELPYLWTRPKAEVVDLVTQVSGWELIEAAWQRGDGILFFTPHLGCFEITAQYIAVRTPITVLYRRPKQAWLAPLMEAGRGACDFTLSFWGRVGGTPSRSNTEERRVGYGTGTTG